MTNGRADSKEQELRNYGLVVFKRLVRYYDKFKRQMSNIILESGVNGGGDFHLEYHGTLCTASFVQDRTDRNKEYLDFVVVPDSDEHFDLMYSLVGEGLSSMRDIEHYVRKQELEKRESDFRIRWEMKRLPSASDLEGFLRGHMLRHIARAILKIKNPEIKRF